MKLYISFLFCITLLSCNTNKNQVSIDDTYIAKFEEYKKDGAQSRINYLQLTGLFKLNTEANTFGRDSINDFVLNIEELPSQIGEISIYKDSLVFSAKENIIVKNNQDSIITTYHLELDKNGSSIKLYHKQLNWQVITRSKQYYLRVWDTKNPAIEAFNGFERFKLNPEFIFEGLFTYYKESKSEIVKSKVDGQRKTSFIGKITFEYNGETHDLDVGKSGFTMVSDETTGDETYGGGRYIDLNIPETDGLVMLDFNYLYNPPCAFSKFTTCLYPPRQNVLPFKILAGEKIKLNNN
jgi:uncharacterized protein